MFLAGCDGIGLAHGNFSDVLLIKLDDLLIILIKVDDELRPNMQIIIRYITAFSVGESSLLISDA